MAKRFAERTKDKQFIKKHADEIWNIMERSYASIGGFKTYSSIYEMIGRVSLIRYGTDNKDNIICAALYDDNKGGEKLVGCGTLHNTDEEKDIIYSIVLNDAKEYSQWHWAEVSGAMERIFQKCGGNPIPAELAKEILNKRNEKFVLDDDSHYYRMIGDKMHRKIIYGFKDLESYNNVINNIAKLTGFANYNDWKKYTNNKKIVKIMEWKSSEIYDRVVFCIDCCDTFMDLWDDDKIYEIPKEYYNFIESIYEEIINEYMDEPAVRKRSGLLKTVKFMLENISIIPTGSMFNAVKTIVSPIVKLRAPIISGKI